MKQATKDGIKFVFDLLMKLMDKGHVYLHKYKLIAIFIVFFFAWQCHELTQWYYINYYELKDWQNAPVIGIILSYIAALKLALSHILDENYREDNNNDSTS